jgi:hypothetical protein
MLSNYQLQYTIWRLSSLSYIQNLKCRHDYDLKIIVLVVDL